MTPTEFDQLFYKEVEKGLSSTDAFWKVNDDYFDKHGMYRYSDYNSYRVSKWKRLNK